MDSVTTIRRKGLRVGREQFPRRKLPGAVIPESGAVDAYVIQRSQYSLQWSHKMVEEYRVYNLSCPLIIWVTVDWAWKFGETLRM